MASNFGTEPPTGTSLRAAKSKLQQSTAEVGPQPAALNMNIAADTVAKPKLSSAKQAASTKAAPYQQTRKGKRPIRVHNLIKKAGDVMDPMLTDPLMLYLQKEAAKDSAKEQIPLTDLVDGMGILRDNLANMPLGKEEHELSSQPPQPTKDMTGKINPEIYDRSEELFDNAHTTRRKYTDKDHAFEGFDSSVVDRILGL
jgi:hypothetical protein